MTTFERMQRKPQPWPTWIQLVLAVGAVVVAAARRIPERAARAGVERKALRSLR